MKRVILASQSARRIEMMKRQGYNPEIVPADLDESFSGDLDPKVAVMYLAFQKAMCSAKLAMESSKNKNAVVIAADTVVVHEGKIIGKPVDANDAFQTLQKLKNDMHHVITGVCLITVTDDLETAVKKCFFDDTKVYFKGYTDRELRAYVETDEPYDLAGGYAIQKTFAKYVDHIEGDYDNVVGFPWYRIEPMLAEELRG